MVKEMSEDDPAEITKRDWRELKSEVYGTKSIIQKWAGAFMVIATVFSIIGWNGVNVLRGIEQSQSEIRESAAVEKNRVDTIQATSQRFSASDAMAADAQLESRLHDWVEAHFQRTVK